MKSDLIKRCLEMNSGESFTVADVKFEELFLLKYPPGVADDPSLMFTYNKFKIFAKLKEDHNMQKWNGHHPVEENIRDYVCLKDTKVLVWMVSRMGDVGITPNLEDASGYECRLDPAKLYDWEFIKL